MEPCGSPDVHAALTEVQFAIATEKDLPLRQDVNQLNAVPLIPI